MGVGALLGITLLRIFPGTQESLLWWLLPIGLSILFAIGAGFAKGFIKLVTLALGALAGGLIVLGVLDLFGLDWGIVNWILAILGATLGAGLMSRFEDWAMIILVALVGAILTTRGLQMLIPFVQGALASIIGLVLFAGSLAYHGGIFGKKKPEK